MIGVAAGLMVGLFGWLSNALLDHHREQEQINHMRNLVTNGREEFYKPVDLHPVASPERIRVLRFKEMEAHLRNALERRSTHVPYDYLYAIERAFSDIKKHERYGPTTSEGISCDSNGASRVNIQIYADAYSKLEKAFGLPESTTALSNVGHISDNTAARKVMCRMHDPVQVVVVGGR